MNDKYHFIAVFIMSNKKDSFIKFSWKKSFLEEKK